jgi:hypothetical protein
MLGGVVGAGSGEAPLRSDRGGVDDCPRAAPDHVGQHKAQSKEHPAQVYIQHPIEHRDIVFVGRGEIAFDPGIVEEPVDPAHRFERGLGIALNLRFIGAIGVVTEHRVPGIGQRPDPLFQPFGVDVDQHHLRAFAGEDFAGRIANRPGRASHQHGLAFVAFHLAAPLRKGRVSMNKASRGVSNFRKARACSGVRVALIGMVPKTLPLSTSSSPLRSILLTSISSDLSEAKTFMAPRSHRSRCLGLRP